LNKSVQTGNFYTQTLVTYDRSGDAKLITSCKNRIKHCWTNINSITKMATKIDNKRCWTLKSFTKTNTVSYKQRSKTTG